MRIAIIGAGRQGTRRAKAAMEAGDEILAVADQDLGIAKALAKTCGCGASRDWKDLASNQGIEAAVICTPNDSHARISIAFARAGKHIFCEKPLARSVKEAVTVVKAVAKSSVALTCGFTLRFHPGIVQVKEWIDEEKLGEVMYLRCVYGIAGRTKYDADWRMNKRAAGGGELMDQGVHVLDLSRWLAGEVVEATGLVNNFYWKKAGVEDNAFFILKSNSGVVSSCHASWTEWVNMFRLEVFGKEGYALVNGLGGSYGLEEATLGKRDFQAPFSQTTVQYRGEDKSLVAEWSDFVGAITKGRKPRVGPTDALQAIVLSSAIYQSSRQGKTVKVPLAWRGPEGC